MSICSDDDSRLYLVFSWACTVVFTHILIMSLGWLLTIAPMKHLLDYIWSFTVFPSGDHSDGKESSPSCKYLDGGEEEKDLAIVASPTSTALSPDLRVFSYRDAGAIEEIMYCPLRSQANISFDHRLFANSVITSGKHCHDTEENGNKMKAFTKYMPMIKGSQKTPKGRYKNVPFLFYTSVMVQSELSVREELVPLLRSRSCECLDETRSVHSTLSPRGCATLDPSPKVFDRNAGGDKVFCEVDRFHYDVNQQYIEALLNMDDTMTATLYLQLPPKTQTARCALQTDLLIVLLKSFLWPKQNVSITWVPNLTTWLITIFTSDKAIPVFKNETIHNNYRAVLLLSKTAAKLFRHKDLTFIFNLALIMETTPSKILILQQLK